MKPKHSKVLLLIDFLLGIVMVWGGMIYSVYSASQYYWAGIIAALVDEVDHIRLADGTIVKMQ